jgi:uncharacterized protein YdeI (YjbR/CyaY-like superfamily)
LDAIYFESPQAFRDWLAKNHEGESEVLVGFWKRGTGKPSLTWPESVDQALCYGWIDGIRRSVDADRYTIRFTPRKQRSTWSNINIKRVGELKELGLMTQAGLKAFEARTAERSGAYSFENRGVMLSPEYEKRFKANRKAWAWFEKQAPWYRRTSVFWVMSAKREETRERRLKTLIEQCEAGQTIGPLTRPGGRPAAGT